MYIHRCDNYYNSRLNIATYITEALPCTARIFLACGYLSDTYNIAGYHESSFPCSKCVNKFYRQKLKDGEISVEPAVDMNY